MPKSTKELIKDGLKKMMKKKAERLARKTKEINAQKEWDRINNKSQTPAMKKKRDAMKIIGRHKGKERLSRPPEKLKPKPRRGGVSWSISPKGKIEKHDFTKINKELDLEDKVKVAKKHIIKNKPKSPKGYNEVKRQLERAKRLSRLKKFKETGKGFRKQKVTSKLKELSLKEKEILKKMKKRKSVIKAAKTFAGKGVAAAGATGGVTRLADALFSVEKVQAPDLPKSEQKKKKEYNKLRKSMKAKRLKNLR